MLTKTLDIDISKELEPIWGVEEYEGVNILIRYHGHPIGWIYLPVQKPVISIEKLSEAISDTFGFELLQIVLGDEIQVREIEHEQLPPISVIVCTYNRVELLRNCLRSLLELDYPEYEIIVVNNGPCAIEQSKIMSHRRIRYVDEGKSGLSRARNQGITEARHDIIAFIDDDASADKNWLRAVARGFVNPKVVAVTGLVAPAELQTAAQVFSEYNYGKGCGLKPRLIHRDLLSDTDMLWAKSFGNGCNMAFRRHLFSSIEAFDVTLGIGTPSRGGGDTELFHRLVAQGFTLFYQPAALVWHKHKRDNFSLRQTAFDSGRSFGIYLLTTARKGSMNRRFIFKFILHNWLFRAILRRPRRPERFPRHLIAAEFVGALTSLWVYCKMQLQGEQAATRSESQTVPSGTVTGIKIIDPISRR